MRLLPRVLAGFALPSALATALLLAPLAAARAGPADDAKKAVAEERYADAVKAYRAVLDAAPTNREATLGYARAVTKGYVADAYDDAATRLRAAAKQKPDDREVRLALGDLYLAWAASDERYRADAEEQYQRVLHAAPDDEDAAIGVARMYFAGADYRRAGTTLDDLLAKKPGSGKALYWKGKILYDEATQAFAANGSKMTDETRATFRSAYDALEASVKAASPSYDAWIHVAYAAQYLAYADASMRDVAAKAYESALALDGQPVAALQGLAALNAGDDAKWLATLARLAKEHPKSPAVLLYHGFALAAAKRNDEAEKAYREYVKYARRPDAGWFLLGELLDAKGDTAGARACREASLRAAPTGRYAPQAIAALERPLLERQREAMASAAKAKALVAEWEAILALAPTSVDLHNNVALFARESYGATKDPSLLKSAISHYETAAARIPPWRDDLEGSVPWAERYGNAQVLNDTGLMFHYYPASRDFAKAEAYYRRAQDWTQFGYGDAFDNLRKILEEQERWQDALEYVRACAEGLRDAQGNPDLTRRAQAATLAKNYERRLGK